jgi:hypothetical protein
MYSSDCTESKLTHAHVLKLRNLYVLAYVLMPFYIQVAGTVGINVLSGSEIEDMLAYHRPPKSASLDCFVYIALLMCFGENFSKRCAVCVPRNKFDLP